MNTPVTALTQEHGSGKTARRRERIAGLFDRIDVLVVLTLAFLPMQFLILMRIGGFGLKPIQLLGVVVLVKVLLNGNLVRILQGPVATFVALWIALNLWRCVSLMWSEAPGAGLLLMTRDNAYFLIALAFIAYLEQLPARKIWPSLMVGFIATTLMFTGFVYIKLAEKGGSIFTFVADAFQRGDAGLLQYRMFGQLYDDPETKSNNRHATMSGFNFFLVLGVVTLLNGKRLEMNGTVWRLVLGAMLLVTAGWIIISVSRSAVVALTIILVLLMGCFMVNSSRGRITLSIALGVAFVGALAFLTEPTQMNRVLALFYDRMVVSSMNNVRAESMPIGIALIEERVLFGYGQGTESKGAGVNYLHNFPLNMWHQGGLIGGGLALAISVMIVWVGATNTLGAMFSGSKGSGACMTAGAALLVIPFVRSMVSGSGDLVIQEWIPLVFALRVIMPESPLHRVLAGDRQIDAGR